ncbi:hypothetical protein B0H63DRAFT_225783 [Podospora didyma]|uniref:Secreted protein n=1 Tax=Podospora didyma TaxID=330526 RepID=A0AAE0NCN5_9PEZI|nr:hypothetical protein B0H63DRAFT_225783 [Podospora didyma]
MDHMLQVQTPKLVCFATLCKLLSMLCNPLSANPPTAYSSTSLYDAFFTSRINRQMILIAKPRVKNSLVACSWGPLADRTGINRRINIPHFEHHFKRPLPDVT